MPQNLLAFLVGLYLVGTLTHASSDHERQPYIVYMGELPSDELSVADRHHDLLLASTGDESTARACKIYSYGRSFNGFVARLLPHEAEKLSREDSVVSVFQNTINQLHTTRSWSFIGMTHKVKRRPQVESNIIVGMLDSGIYVDAPSFNDKGYGPAPAKWRGKCVTGANFTGCNNKVIGARYYMLDSQDPSGNPSPTDEDGHGTHTSSTVAGDIVKGASLYGLARGSARGGVPSARIAMYKVCWRGGCSDMDVLAAFDDAIADGVDLISISIGGAGRELFEDPISIGSFHALKKGILTSCSAGNDGPYFGSVENVAPWIMTVAANSIDRQFVTEVELGNGVKAKGISVNTFAPKKKMYPLTDGAGASSGGDNYGNVSACDYGVLSLNKVEGKIVFCSGPAGQDYTISELKGAGVIMSTDTPMDAAFTTVVPGTYVPLNDATKIDHYINTTKNPQAVVYRTRTTNMTAPHIASFSARGPQSINLNILKPDLSAPGLNILAAYSELTTITGDSTDNRISPFNILSGTSMSCPHAAAAAAYVKSFHPTWSPAAIKSALMTTAMKIRSSDAELASGSGQINPRRAVYPGLIYDISRSSYISFLCKEGYNGTTLSLLVGDEKQYKCSDFKPAQGTDGLNYPSMHTQLLEPSSRISAVFYRTVTHVGHGKSVYYANVTAPKGLSIRVVPHTLEFSRSYQRRSFKVVVKGGPMKDGTQFLSALLEWSDTNHTVKSPILIYSRLPVSDRP